MWVLLPKYSLDDFRSCSWILKSLEKYPWRLSDQIVKITTIFLRKLFLNTISLQKNPSFSPPFIPTPNLFQYLSLHLLSYFFYFIFLVHTIHNHLMSLSQFSRDSDSEDVNVKYTLDKQKQKQQAILLLKVYFISFIYLSDYTLYSMLVFIFNSSNNH